MRQTSMEEIIKLNESTLAAAEEIKTIELFNHCGEEVANDNVIQVLSWDEAIAAAQSKDWAYASMESINLCSDILVTTARDRYQQWNDIVDTIKYILRDIFEDVNRTQPADVSKNVRWVLMNYLVEKEYEDLYPNGYYEEWIKWYFAGHHICGWKGEFPQGQLIIF